jgi:hypothetical protein
VFAKVSNSAISCLIRQSPGMLIGGPEVVKLVDAKMQTVAEVKIGKVHPSRILFFFLFSTASDVEIA